METCVDCGKPLDEGDGEFWEKYREMGEALNGLNVGECLDMLAMHAAETIGCLDLEHRPQALLDFIADASDKTARVDDVMDDGPVGTIQ